MTSGQRSGAGAGASGEDVGTTTKPQRVSTHDGEVHRHVEEPVIPSGMRLRGAGDYRAWKVQITKMALSASLTQWITPGLLIPKHVGQFDLEADEDERKDSLGWEQGDARMKNLILGSCSGTPQRQIAGCSTALEMWLTLERQYGGSGRGLSHQAFVAFFSMKCEDYKDITTYILIFRENVRELQEGMSVDDTLPTRFITTQFIVGLSRKYPTWARRVRANQQTELNKNLPPTSLEDLISDITRKLDLGSSTQEGLQS